MSDELLDIGKRMAHDLLKYVEAGEVSGSNIWGTRQLLEQWKTVFAKINPTRSMFRATQYNAPNGKQYPVCPRCRKIDQEPLDISTGCIYKCDGCKKEYMVVNNKLNLEYYKSGHRIVFHVP